ncbi:MULTISPECIES: TIGR03757 family integrating conjugative element protein [Pseudomonas]|uniref:TIGR03757 family integrating conjugative element protein n=1 Tax=Pseudomonas TaxID=286 RepID=UPI000CD5726C|nr:MULTISPECIES: TIGR03757 family integrating conjugative element protein [Pseudomonas]RBH52417.1 TIGR03757 family integrating conjugative element protein [Pseudomonas sp. MWU13-2860]
MTLSHPLRLLGLTTLLTVAPTCFASTWVITDSAHPVEVTPDVRLFHLDRLDQLEAELSSLLPDDPAQAQALFRESLTAEAAAEISQAHQDVVDAWSLGVTKIPAVVVDQRYVVYGDPNLEQALAKIEQFRRDQP